MPKRPRSPDSDDTTTAAAAPATFKTVFVNTNVDTHLALITSDSDTLSDLKDEIALEHGRLFPEMGEIKIHSLKVKRKGFFYHLPDYMLVKTAFEGVNKTWFFDVDVSKPTDNKQNNKANKLLGSHVESEPQKDDEERSSSIVRKSKKNRKDSQAPASFSLPKCGEDNECIKQNAEFEKRGASSGKDHDPGVNCAEELDPSRQGLEKPVESTLPSASSDMKEANAHAKRSKRAKSSKPKFMDDQVDQVRNSTAVSLLVSPDTIDQELPGSAESVKGRLISGKHQVLALEQLGSSDIHQSEHDGMLKVNNINKTEERTLSPIHDPENKGNEELDCLHCKSTALSAVLVTKEVKTHEDSRKKRSKISRSGVQDEQVDRSKDSTAAFAAKVLQNHENTVTDNDSNMDQVPKNNLCSNSEFKFFQVNESNNVGEKKQSDPSALLVSKKVKTHDNSKKKRSKISRSGVQDEQVDRSKDSTADLAAKVQQNRESIVAKNDSNMEQVPKNNLPSNSECADVLEAFEVNESNNVGEKKQSAPTASLVTKEAKTHDNSRKKKSKISRSGVQDEQVDRSKGTTAENDSNVEQVRKNNLSSNSECADILEAFEVNESNNVGEKKRSVPSASLVTNEAKTHDNSRKKKSKISRSGVHEEQVDRSKGTTAENDSNVEQVPKNNLSSNSECADVLKAFEVNESNNVGEKKQSAPSASLVTKEAKTHDNSRKKKSKISRSGVQVEQVDRSKDSTADFAATVQQTRESVVAGNDSNMEQVPKNNLSSNSECADVLEAFEVNESNNVGEKKQITASASLVTKEAKTHDNSRKKKSKISSSGFQDEQVDRSKDSTADFADTVQQNRESIVAENDSNVEQVPENNLTSNCECADVLKAIEVNESNNVGEKKQSAPSASLVTKEVKTHDNGRKKKAKISRSGVQDEQADHSKGSTADFTAAVQQNQESIVAENDSNMEQVPENNLSSKSECPGVLEAFEVNESTDVGEKKQKAASALLVAKEVKTHDNSRKKKSKIFVPGVQDEQVDRSKDSTADFVAKVQQNRESIVAEKDSNMEQVPENNLSSNSECPDVGKALKVNESSSNVGGKKQNTKKAVKDVQETVAMNRDADQINDIVSPSTDNPEQSDLARSSENDQIPKKVEGCDLSVNNNFEEILLRVRLSNNDQNEPMIEPFSNTNTSSATVAEEQKMGGPREKKRTRKAVSVICQDAMDTEKSETHTRPSSSEPSRHTDMQVEKDVDHLLLSERIRASARKSSVSSGGKETPPVESSLNEDHLLLSERIRASARKSSVSSGGKETPPVESSLNEVSAEVGTGKDNEWLEEQKMGGSREKKRTRKAVSVVCQDAMDTEKSETHTRPSSSEPSRHTDMQDEKDVDDLLISEMIKASARKSSVSSGGKETPPVESSPNEVSAEVGTGEEHTRPSSSEPCRHTDMQVEKDVDDLLLPKRIKASTRKSSVSSGGKETPPVESSPNEVSAEVGTGRDREVSECIGKETNVQQYFDSSHHRDEDFRESSAGAIAKNNIEENIAPSVVPAPELHQDLPQPSQKDHMVSSTDQANNLTESKRVKNPKKKILKRGVPYAAASSDLDEIRIPHKPVSSAFSNGSDAAKTVTNIMENVKSLAVPGVNSSSKTNEIRPLPDRKDSSLRHHATRGKNPSRKPNGQTVNKDKQKKSFGTMPKAIFRDASSDCSLDGNGSVDSSGSTRTPSDYSSSSSDSSEDEKRKGLDDKDKARSKKSIFNSEISSPMDISLDTILKSSSRFKKARLTASQQLEDPDSQFDDLLE